MIKFFLNLNLNRKLALITFIFGFIALFAGSPYHNNNVTVATDELELIIQNEADQITSDELAEMIIAGKSDYRLVDLRSEKESEEYSIPGSENIQIVSLDKSSLNRNEKIILYSENIVHSAQAWMILKIKKFKSVYVLKGGMHEWKENILFPSLPENADEKQNNDFRKKEEVSRYFGGSPRTGDNTGINKDTPKIDLPKMQTSPGTTPVTAPKKKKEGC